MNQNAMKKLLVDLGWEEVSSINDNGLSEYRKPRSAMIVEVDYENTRFYASFDGKRWRDLDFTTTARKTLSNILSN